MARKLQNHLRTYRKRTGLSQDEVAFLLGCRSGAKVSRYERFSRQPNLETILACEVVFGTPVRDLLAGTFQKVEDATLERARLLAEKLSTQEPGRIAARKLEVLRAMGGTPEAGFLSKHHETRSPFSVTYSSHRSLPDGFRICRPGRSGEAH
jgi:transcriptional regulator with XRE-family HTH domain